MTKLLQDEYFLNVETELSSERHGNGERFLSIKAKISRVWSTSDSEEGFKHFNNFSEDSPKYDWKFVHVRAQLDGETADKGGDIYSDDPAFDRTRDFSCPDSLTSAAKCLKKYRKKMKTLQDLSFKSSRGIDGDWAISVKLAMFAKAAGVKKYRVNHKGWESTRATFIPADIIGEVSKIAPLAKHVRRIEEEIIDRSKEDRRAGKGFWAE